MGRTKDDKQSLAAMAVIDSLHLALLHERRGNPACADKHFARAKTAATNSGMPRVVRAFDELVEKIRRMRERS